MPACFEVGAVEREILETRFAGQVRHFPSVASTNQLALEAAAGGARAGVWVADEQTAGRGRGGHAWHSAADGGLYVSVLAAPRIAAQDAMKIPLLTGLAVQAAIADVAGLTADIRWPNDLLLGGRKCGGVLVESASDAAGLRYAVIGVGVNVNQASFPGELAQLATSLRLASGCMWSRTALLASLLVHLERELARLDDAAGGRELLRRFTAASTWVQGKRVKVGEAEGYTGWTRGLDELGFLLVEDDAGVLRTVLSGGVRAL